MKDRLGKSRMEIKQRRIKRMKSRRRKADEDKNEDSSRWMDGKTLGVKARGHLCLGSFSPHSHIVTLPFSPLPLSSSFPFFLFSSFPLFLSSPLPLSFPFPLFLTSPLPLLFSPLLLSLLDLIFLCFKISVGSRASRQ